MKDTLTYKNTKYYRQPFWQRLNPFRKKYKAVILIHGGAARAMAAWGALQFLVHNGVTPVAFVTRSAGGMPALAYVQNHSDKRVRERFRTFNLKEIVPQIHYPLFNQERYFAFANQAFGNTELSKLRIPVYMSAIRLNDKKYMYLHKGFGASEALIASSAVPAVIGPVSIKNEKYLDGDLVGGSDVDFAKRMFPDHKIIRITLTRGKVGTAIELGLMKAIETISGGFESDYALNLEADYTLHLDNIEGDPLSPLNIDTHVMQGYEIAKAEWLQIREELSDR